MSPTTRTNASKSSRRKTSVKKIRKTIIKTKKIPKTLNGMTGFFNYGVRVDDYFNGDSDTNIQPFVESESVPPSNSHINTPQDTESFAFSFYSPADGHSQIPVSTRVEPSHHGMSIPFQYDSDFNTSTQAEDIFSWTNNTCQSQGRYDPSHFIPGSSPNMEHGVEPYQQWLDSNLNAQYFTPPIFPHMSNASSIFPIIGDSDDIFADVTGTGSSHLTMTFANDLPFSNYDPTGYNYYM